jgi:DNA-binding response OmpR family regulator
MRILLIEDQEETAQFILNGLRTERFAADWAQTAEKGLLCAKVNAYDCAVIALAAGSGMTGLDVCRELRANEKTFPILLLSAARDAETRIKALNTGADDFLMKPFLFAELLARLRALLRREKAMTGPVLKTGDIALDTMAHRVTCGEKELSLNRKEFALLEYFMRNPGTLLTRTMILEHVWDTATDQFTNTVDVHISFLRRKLGKARSNLVKTVHGYGYQLVASTSK